MSNSIIIIPSRLAATRLPNKPLIKINNKTLIMRVYEKAIKSQIGEVYVATCNKEIALEVRKNGGKFIMTDINHTTGTDRVFEASQKLDLRDTDFVMNIQGDEPMINPLDIKNLNISTLAHKIKRKEDYSNKNIVKVITKNKISDNSTTEALNFHRVIKEKSYNNIYQHFGVYLYKYSALKKFINFEKSENETKEKLEQLRAIDNNMKINVILANYFSSGIDTKKDLEDYLRSFKK